MEPLGPPAEQIAQLKAQHASRWPQRLAIPMIGDDDDSEVELVVLVGTPESYGPDARPGTTRAWSNICAAVYDAKPSPPDSEIVRDCVMLPDSITMASWLERWPGLNETLAGAIRLALGMSATFFGKGTAPAAEETPAELAALVKATPRTRLRSAHLPGNPGQRVVIAMQTPTSTVWQLFTANMAKADADHARLAREFASSVVVGISGMSSVSAMFDRWPCSMLAIGKAASRLAGLGARVRLGE